MDIAVIGAGVAGLASATLLARQGHRVVLYERFETPAPIGAGLMLQPTGLAALERLGSRELMESLGHRIDRIHGLTVTGKTVFDLGYGALAPDLYACAVHRAALHGVLWDGFERSGARLECDVTVLDARSQSGKRVVPLDDKGRAHPAVDLIVDASGARSGLRALVSERKPREFAYGAVWAAVEDHGIGPHALTQRYVDAHVMIGHLPIGRVESGGPSLAAFFWSLKPDNYPAWRSEFASWRAEVAGLWPQMSPVVDTLEDPDSLSLASYAHFTAERVSRGRVVLVGDAAHTTSPQLGQGANQGLIDAVVVSDAIARLVDLDSALAAYARARRSHVRFYQLASAVMTPFFQSDSRWLAAVRDGTFDRMKAIPYLRREMVRTLAGLKTGLFQWRRPRAIVDAGHVGARS